jgi:hypothetical protein
MKRSPTAWPSIAALGLSITLVNAFACGGRNVPTDTQGDASAQAAFH